MRPLLTPHKKASLLQSTQTQIVLMRSFLEWCGLSLLIGVFCVRGNWSEPSSERPVAACWSIKPVCTRPWPSVRPVRHPRALTVDKIGSGPFSTLVLPTVLQFRAHGGRVGPQMFHPAHPLTSRPQTQTPHQYRHPAGTRGTGRRQNLFRLRVHAGRRGGASREPGVRRDQSGRSTLPVSIHARVHGLGVAPESDGPRTPPVRGDRA